MRQKGENQDDVRGRNKFSGTGNVQDLWILFNSACLTTASLCSNRRAACSKNTPVATAGQTRSTPLTALPSPLPHRCWAHHEVCRRPRGPRRAPSPAPPGCHAWACALEWTDGHLRLRFPLSTCTSRAVLATVLIAQLNAELFL